MNHTKRDKIQSNAFHNTLQIKSTSPWFAWNLTNSDLLPDKIGTNTSSPKYANDCSYYLAYIRYTQKRYDEALKDFLPLQDDPKYKELVPYYIAEIYAIKKNYDKAQIVAQNYLSAYPNNEHAAEMYRILGDAY